MIFDDSERPRSLSLFAPASSGILLRLVLVLVLVRDRADRPPIMELKDILLNEADLSGTLGVCCAEFVLSRALMMSWEASVSSCARVVVSRLLVVERRGVVGRDAGGVPQVEVSGDISPAMAAFGTDEERGTGAATLSSTPSVGTGSCPWLLLGRLPPGVYFAIQLDFLPLDDIANSGGRGRAEVIVETYLPVRGSGSLKGRCPARMP